MRTKFTRAQKKDAAPILVAAERGDGEGLRYNDGKNRVELIPAIWTWSLGMVLTRGAIKYETRNWERGMSWAYCLGSCSRHILKFMCGERYDPESGCHHLAHAAWNCLALMTYDIRGIGQNDMGVDNLHDLQMVAIEPGPEFKAMAAKKLTAAVKGS